MAVASVRTLAAIMIAVLGQCGAAHAAQDQLDAPLQHMQPPQQPSAGLIHFDMPRQPLQAALDQFHAVTGQSLLYDGAIVEGSMAGAVQGDMSAAAALDNLLAGTGIVARYTSGDAFMLIRPQLPAAAPDPAPALTAKRNYYGLLQAQVVAVLCSNPITIPGSYRLALNLWVGADNAVERVVLHPTGDKRRDAHIHAALSGLVLHGALPADVVLPITIVILPRAPSQTGDCAAAPAPANRDEAP